MKTSELIKQAEELLSKCVDGPWRINRLGESSPYSCDISCGIDGDPLIKIGEVRDAAFIVFARNHMPELITKLKKYEEALEFFKDQNNYVGQHNRELHYSRVILEGPHIARQALEEV